MRCDDLRARAAAFVEGNLPEAEESAVREHILHCRECREVVVRRDPPSMFVVLAREKTPPGFFDGFFDGIRTELPRRGRRFGPRWEPLRLLAAALLVLTLGVAAFLSGKFIVRTAPGGAAAPGLGDFAWVPADASEPGEISGPGEINETAWQVINKRYSVSNYLASNQSAAEVIHLTYDGGEELGNPENSVYRLTMILDEGLSESF